MTAKLLPYLGISAMLLCLSGTRAGESPQSPIDLLKISDVRRDSVKGKWVRRRGSLVALARGTDCLLKIPYRLPDEYELELAVTADNVVKDKTCVALYLGTGDTEFVVQLNPVASCLIPVDGVDPRRNGTASAGPVFASKEESVIKCEVRRNRLTVEVNGSPVIKWDDYGRLGKRKDRSSISLGLGDSVWTVSSMMLSPIQPMKEDTRPIASEDPTKPIAPILGHWRSDDGEEVFVSTKTHIVIKSDGQKSDPVAHQSVNRVVLPAGGEVKELLPQEQKELGEVLERIGDTELKALGEKGDDLSAHPGAHFVVIESQPKQILNKTLVITEIFAIQKGHPRRIDLLRILDLDGKSARKVVSLSYVDDSREPE